jgi:hypothetical protein
VLTRPCLPERRECAGALCLRAPWRASRSPSSRCGSVWLKPSRPRPPPAWSGAECPAAPVGALMALPRRAVKKLFARDLRPADIAGWPKTCLHAKMIGATRTDRPFLRIDTRRLVPNLPDAIILGPATYTGADRIGQRDVQIDDKEARLEANEITTWTTDRLDRLVWPVKSEGEDPLIVPPGEPPNFFGQPLAFLLFKSPAALRRAADALRFDQAFIRYYLAMMAVAVTRPDAETTGEISGGGWHGSCRRIRLARIQEGTGQHGSAGVADSVTKARCRCRLQVRTSLPAGGRRIRTPRPT